MISLSLVAYLVFMVRQDQAFYQVSLKNKCLNVLILCCKSPYCVCYSFVYAKFV